MPLLLLPSSDLTRRFFQQGPNASSGYPTTFFFSRHLLLSWCLPESFGGTIWSTLFFTFASSHRFPRANVLPAFEPPFESKTSFCFSNSHILPISLNTTMINIPNPTNIAIMTDTTTIPQLLLLNAPVFFSPVFFVNHLYLSTLSTLNPAIGNHSKVKLCFHLFCLLLQRSAKPPLHYQTVYPLPFHASLISPMAPISLPMSFDIDVTSLPRANFLIA